MNDQTRCATCGHKRNVHAGKDCLASRCTCAAFVPTFTLAEIADAFHATQDQVNGLRSLCAELEKPNA